MKIGFHLPQWGRGATRDGILAFARTVEAAGLDAAWAADHIVYPIESATPYPYSTTGRVDFGPEAGVIEPFSLLPLVAGATERIALGTSVLVLPMRHPLAVAKTAASIDVLSGGRLVLGVGSGWWAEEFAALDEPFAGRGERMDEQLRIMREAWTAGSVARDSGPYRFAEVACRPLPVQPGGPKVLIGGAGPRVWKRAATLGDGWHAVGSRSDRLAEGRAAVEAAARAAGRDPAELTFSTSMAFTETAEDAVRRFARLHALGFVNVVLTTPDVDDAHRSCAEVERFASEILPLVRRELATAASGG